MKKTNRVVTVLDVYLEVIFWYSYGRAGTYWEPPEYPEIDIEAVLVEGTDVTDLLSDWTMQQIKDKLEIPSKYEDDADYGDYLRDQRRDEELMYKGD